ncbi:MAG: DUF2125 domain-containing protein [Rhodovibrionaceae bacterium]|nr:DUF2125 domain-containing protein [Rhodovibrionaceae bacterium]
MPRRLALALLIFAVSLTALTGLWTWAGWQLEAALTAWAQTRRAEGWTVSYRGPETAGWPLRLTADVEEPVLISPRGFRWQGPEIGLESTLWAPLTLEVNAPGAHEFRWPPLRPGGSGGQATLQSEAADGTAHFAADGRLRRLDVHFRTTRLVQPGQSTQSALAIGEVNLKLQEPLVQVQSGPARVRLDARDLVLPEKARPILGREMARLAFDGRISGSFPQGPLGAALTAWRESGGRVEVDRIDMEWGPLDLTGEGVLGLDAQLRPVGEFTATASGLAQTIDRFVAAGRMEQGAALAAKLALGAFAKTDTKTGRTTLTVPVSFRDGLCYLGPVPLFPVPPLPVILDPA